MSKRFPGASYQLLGPQTQRRMTSHDIICIHTMVGSLPGTDAMFEQGGFSGTESHFGTGGDGKCIQWQDLAFSADANLEGWDRVISIENADKGVGFKDWGGSNVPGFTGPQTEKLVELVAWLCSKEAHAACPSDWTCHREGIPARFIQDSKQGWRGIGVHRQGVDGNFPGGILAGRVPGGERWSTSKGKVCPGDRRIKETVNVLIPRVRKVLDATPAPAKPTRGPAVDAALLELAKARPSKGNAVRVAAAVAALKLIRPWIPGDPGKARRR